MVFALLILVPSTVLASDYYLMCCDGFYHKEGINEGGSLGCTNVMCPEGTTFCATGHGWYKTVRNGRPVQGEARFENCATPGDFKTVYPLFDGFSDFNCQVRHLKEKLLKITGTDQI
ncbi:hypothetical protein AAVH_29049 [Aphelenchoides avenae]|nr:hypothetical protein AAVH_29049 [Aphelenchus avenae]